MRATVLVTFLAVTGALVPTGVAAQVVAPPFGAPSDQAPAQDFGNPADTNFLNRNPNRRSGVSDSAPVTQDPRDSSTRPTQPAASRSQDSRDAALPPPDPSRDAATAPLGEVAPNKPVAN